MNVASYLPVEAFLVKLASAAPVTRAPVKVTSSGFDEVVTVNAAFLMPLVIVNTTLFKAPSTIVDSNKVFPVSSNSVTPVNALIKSSAAPRLIEIKYPPAGATTSYNVHALTCSPFTVVVAGQGKNAALTSKIPQTLPVSKA